MDLQSIIQTIVLLAIPPVCAITPHEAAHGYLAEHFGDYTAFQAGRIAVSLLPNRLAYRFAMIESYGLIVIVALLAARVLSGVIGPVVVVT